MTENSEANPKQSNKKVQASYRRLTILNLFAVSGRFFQCPDDQRSGGGDDIDLHSTILDCKLHGHF